jgi:antitoxin component YwqK of YwqJK toxin-antitoxin module
MKPYFLLFPIICTFFTQSCKTQVTNEKNIVKDSVEIIKTLTDTNEVFQYKNKGILDSTKIFYKNNKLASIDINNPIDSIVSKHYFVTGELKSVLLNKDKIKGAVFYYSYFKDGKPEFTESVKDSTIIYNKDTCKCLSLLLNYYSSGLLKEKGCQGVYNGTGVPVGSWITYDETLNIESKTYYHNDEFGKDFILKESYYKEGKLKSLEKYNNYILYENTKKPIGIWLLYDEKGNVSKSIDYNKGANK